MFYKIAKTLGVIASVTGIIMMVGACSVKSHELFYWRSCGGFSSGTRRQSH